MYATEYDPIKIGSIDGTDTEPHDRAILRAIRSKYVPNRFVKGNPNNTLFVGRLNPRTTEDTIKSEFASIGKIINCRLVKDIVTGKSKQYAFVEFEKSHSVDKAIADMQKESIDGTQIILERQASGRLPGWKPRRLGGGFGGKKESGQLRFGCQDRPFKRPFIITPNIIRNLKIGDKIDQRRDGTGDYNKDERRDESRDYGKDERRHESRDYGKDERRDESRDYGKHERRDHRRDNRRDEKR